MAEAGRDFLAHTKHFSKRIKERNKTSSNTQNCINPRKLAPGVFQTFELWGMGMQKALLCFLPVITFSYGGGE